jgi:hypothetical protein
MEPYWRVSIQGHCASLRLSRLVFGVPAENCCPPSNELSLSQGEIRLLTGSNASLRWIKHQEGVCMASMKKEEARQAVVTRNLHIRCRRSRFHRCSRPGPKQKTRGADSYPDRVVTSDTQKSDVSVITVASTELRSHALTKCAETQVATRHALRQPELTAMEMSGADPSALGTFRFL